MVFIRSYIQHIAAVGKNMSLQFRNPAKYNDPSV
jgi:hypothetical protein